MRESTKFQISPIIFILIIFLFGVLFSVALFFHGLTNLTERIEIANSRFLTSYQIRYEQIINLHEKARSFTITENDNPIFNETSVALLNYQSVVTSEEKVLAVINLEQKLSELTIFIYEKEALYSNSEIQNILQNISATDANFLDQKDLYNVDLLAYNSYLEKFPANLISKFYGLQAKSTL